MTGDGGAPRRTPPSPRRRRRVALGHEPGALARPAARRARAGLRPRPRPAQHRALGLPVPGGPRRRARPRRRGRGQGGRPPARLRPALLGLQRRASSGGGSLDLRVPADRLRDTLRDLSALGKVRSRSESGQDVTASVVGASDRLESARAERASLLRRLRRRRQRHPGREPAPAPGRERDRDPAAARPSCARCGCARTTRRSPSPCPTAPGATRSAGPEDSTKDALDDAVASLQGSLNFLLRAAGALLPLGLLLAAALFGGRALMRRRRESALA